MPSFDFHYVGLTLELVGAFRIAIATLFGAALGLERSIAGKHAGMRTYALVSAGSALFSVVGVIASYHLAMFTGVNPLQMAGSVVVGIGFIGMGLAAFRNEPTVELTTAAGLFMVAAIGMTAGFGLYILSFVATAISMVVFRSLAKFEWTVRSRYGDHKN